MNCIISEGKIPKMDYKSEDRLFKFLPKSSATTSKMFGGVEALQNGKRKMIHIHDMMKKLWVGIVSTIEFVAKWILLRYSENWPTNRSNWISYLDFLITNELYKHEYVNMSYLYYQKYIIFIDNM